MGKGDKKTKRGKITIGSFGVSRPSRTKKSTAVVTPKVKKEKSTEVVAEKKAVAKKAPVKKAKKEESESAE